MNTLLDGSGRIELPGFVQMKLGVKPGDELALDEENGRWFIMLARSSKDRHEPRRTDGDCDVTPPEPPRSVPRHTADDMSCDELNWEELDYEPVPLQHAVAVAIHVAQRGRLKPMVHLLDEE